MMHCYLKFRRSANEEYDFFRSGILAGLILLVAGSVSGQNASKPPESDASAVIPL